MSTGVEAVRAVQAVDAGRTQTVEDCRDRVEGKIADAGYSVSPAKSTVFFSARGITGFARCMTATSGSAENPDKVVVSAFAISDTVRDQHIKTIKQAVTDAVG